jgi:DNA mismatch repair protein MSH5
MTGPNYSGKSVYLKQVALIVYMAHIGWYFLFFSLRFALQLICVSFVPADRARVGITDKILTRITTKESVSKVQSAFMIDVQQISLALSLVTRRSLLVIDEFGKGTDAIGKAETKRTVQSRLTNFSDGAGLACGVLEYLLELGDDRPKVLAATHFHGVFPFDLDA